MEDLKNMLGKSEKSDYTVNSNCKRRNGGKQ
jgi:hypothetical protein